MRVIQKQLSFRSQGGLSLGSSAILWQFLGFCAQHQEENLCRETAASGRLFENLGHCAS